MLEDLTSPELFAVYLSLLSALAGVLILLRFQPAKVLLTTCIGFILATSGFDAISGEPRMQFFGLQVFSAPVGILSLLTAIFGLALFLDVVARAPAPIDKRRPGHPVLPSTLLAPLALTALLLMFFPFVRYWFEVHCAGDPTGCLPPVTLLDLFLAALAVIVLAEWKLGVGRRLGTDARIAAPILLVLIIAAFSLTERMEDVWVMVALGLGGYLLRRLDYPLVPVLAAAYVGPIMEHGIRMSLVTFAGDATGFLTQPLAGPLLALSIALPVAAMAARAWADRRAARAKN